MKPSLLPPIAFCLLAGACARVDHLGRAPSFSDMQQDTAVVAMQAVAPPTTILPQKQNAASLWRAGQQSLLGDRRAEKRGDILTVVIEIDDKAEISNTTKRSRDADEALNIPQLFGLPQRVQGRLPDGARLAEAVSLSSSSSSGGAGSVRRNEKLTLRVAATVVSILPNGILEIAGLQEVRVNQELRELLVAGYIRPEDVSRRNEIAYDKIASAKISYGGRGQISDVQQPRIGQQIADILLPF
jgi:flagellar L-ring protein precursor FlgH